MTYQKKNQNTRPRVLLHKASNHCLRVESTHMAVGRMCPRGTSAPSKTRACQCWCSVCKWGWREKWAAAWCIGSCGPAIRHSWANPMRRPILSSRQWKHSLENQCETMQWLALRARTLQFQKLDFCSLWHGLSLVCRRCLVTSWEDLYSPSTGLEDYSAQLRGVCCEIVLFSFLSLSVCTNSYYTPLTI